MFEIYKREIGSFFSSLTGYVVIVVYLLVNALFMWVLPGDWNILNSNYAGLDTLFHLSPWIFLFLVPAVTMRTISEEKRSGTLELLLTRPLSERHIIYGKFLAAVSLILLTLLPGIIAYFSVYHLGETRGNLDAGGILGAYIGLFFLASVYGACGVLASSLTDNIVVAFIIAVLFSLILYIGFDAFAYLPGLKKIDEIVVTLGINEHYQSMSRGVIDIKDITYFVVFIIILLEATHLVLLSKNWHTKKGN